MWISQVGLRSEPTTSPVVMSMAMKSVSSQSSKAQPDALTTMVFSPARALVLPPGPTTSRRSAILRA